MEEQERRAAAGERTQEAAGDDRAETLRRAIRAVAEAERVRAATEAGHAHPAVDLVRRRAERALWDADPGRVAVREATYAYVRLLRDAGEPPERVVVRVKDVIRDTLTSELAHDEHARLAEAVVGWGIEAYYQAE